MLKLRIYSKNDKIVLRGHELKYQLGMRKNGVRASKRVVKLNDNMTNLVGVSETRDLVIKQKSSQEACKILKGMTHTYAN